MNLRWPRARWLCYDGCSTISGVKKPSSQTDEPRAVFTHFYGHCIYLAASDSIVTAWVCGSAKKGAFCCWRSIPGCYNHQNIERTWESIIHLHRTWESIIHLHCSIKMYIISWMLQCYHCGDVYRNDMKMETPLLNSMKHWGPDTDTFRPTLKPLTKTMSITDRFDQHDYMFLRELNFIKLFRCDLITKVSNGGRTTFIN